MKSRKHLLALVASSSLASSLLIAPTASASQLLDSVAQQQLSSNPSTVLAEEGKCGEGKCGEGKCGGDKDKEKEGKCGEGKCGGDKDKEKEGKD